MTAQPYHALRRSQPARSVWGYVGAILGAALLSGCSIASRSLAEWKPMGGTGPWSATGQRAVLETRDYHVSVMANVQGHDERWRALDGQTVDAWKACERLVDQLAQTGELQRWPETQSYGYKDGALRIGPYQIYLVSLFPDVAILVPHDFGPLTNRSNADLVGWGEDAFSDRRIMNYIYHGTFVPGAGRVYWLSADLGVPLKPATITADGGFPIVHSKIELVGKPESSGFAVTRLK